MKRRKRPAAHSSHDRWLVSYADFITLLFAFFVVLYAAAEVDKKKMGQVAASIQAAFQDMGAFPATPTLATPQPNSQPPSQAVAEPVAPAPMRPSQAPPESAGNPDLSSLRQELEQALAAEIARGEVAIRTGPDGLIVSLREIGFFDSGSAGFKAHSEAAFRRMAGLLQRHPFQLRIEGHTDNVPIHNSLFNSNWELSTARATEMVRLLITEYDFPPQRLSAAGYGEYHPIASNDEEQGRALNRRVDVVILGKPQPASESALPR